jgi:membrane fusion protein (multidrug efflux system)
LLLPGMYVRVRLEQAQVDGGVLLPQQAVTRGAQADTVLVVAQDGSVAPRPVKLGGARGNQWVVLGGLQAGEQVMVDGFQKFQMAGGKGPVKAVPWQAPPVGAGMGSGDAASAAASASASAPAAPAAAASR